MQVGDKSYYDVIITGNGVRLVRDKIVCYHEETIHGIPQTMVYLSNGKSFIFDPEELPVEELDHFMTSTNHSEIGPIYTIKK